MNGEPQERVLERTADGRTRGSAVAAQERPGPLSLVETKDAGAALAQMRSSAGWPVMRRTHIPERWRS